jgi:tryptophan synthase beta subunit
MPLILDLESAYEHAKTDPASRPRWTICWKHYVGRPLARSISPSA